MQKGQTKITDVISEWSLIFIATKNRFLHLQMALSPSSKVVEHNVVPGLTNF